MLLRLASSSATLRRGVVTTATDSLLLASAASREVDIPLPVSSSKADRILAGMTRMWKKTRGAIEGQPPVPVARLKEKAKDGKLRGYRAAEPSETLWMRPASWRR